MNLIKNRTPLELIKTNTIIKAYAGSLAYGTNLPTSDIDFRGIFVADPINIRTPFYTINEAEVTSEEDTKLYELNQFMKLALDCNPNIIELLWTDESDIVFKTPAYDLLRAHASDLLSAKVAHTTTGYAMSQLSRIKGHNKWINNPMPEAAPRQEEFFALVTNFTSAKVFKWAQILSEISTGHSFASFGNEGESTLFGVYKTKLGAKLFDHTGAVIIDDTLDKGENKPLYIVKFNKAEYGVQREKWANYWDWKKNRNQARSALEELHGFDTKHAMHLVRLLRMGKEALETGIIHVKRDDAQELLSIRNGALKYEEILDYANKMNDDIASLLKTTSLPTRPNQNLAANLILQIQDITWNQHRDL
jgi:hypothetical protein